MYEPFVNALAASFTSRCRRSSPEKTAGGQLADQRLERRTAGLRASP